MKIKYDQHFLKDKKVVDKCIKNAKINNGDIILEIGAGKGFLSEKIIREEPEKLIIVEIDKTLKNDLKKICENNSNVEIHIKSIFDVIEDLNFNKILANIPYSITEPFFKKLISKTPEKSIILFSKKSYNLINNKKSKWKYYLNAFFEIKEIMEVSGDSFEPKTKVKSSLVEFELKEIANSKFEEFFRTLFSKEKRRAKNAIVYSIHEILNIGKREIIKKIEERSLYFPNKKLENLSNLEFITIMKKINEIFFEKI
jgi:16S rRNA (adenine1518-N6/adenine1519-N6)-dimethyltransferase